MAALTTQPMVIVSCSTTEFKWASLFFQKTEPVFHVDIWDFHEEVTKFSMQDEPEFAHQLIADIVRMLNGSQKPESIIFC